MLDGFRVPARLAGSDFWRRTTLIQLLGTLPTGLLSLSRRRTPILIYLGALVPALAVALGQPVWSRVDEAQHYDLIAQYAHGSYALSDQTRIRPETLGIMHQTGVYRWSAKGTDPAPAVIDPNDFERMPAGLNWNQRGVWTRRHLWSFSYESMQPPLYYLAMVPFWWAGDLLGGPLGAVYGVRIANALLMAFLAPLAWVLALRLLPGRHPVAAIAAATTVAPGIVLNTTQVTNDVAAAVLGGIVSLQAVRGFQEGFSRRSAWLLGVLLGAAMMSKLTAGGAVFMVGAALLAPVLQRGVSWREQLGHLGRVAGGSLAVMAPWLAANLLLYRRLLPPSQLMSYVIQPGAVTLVQVQRDLEHAFFTYWTGEPVYTLAQAGLLELLVGVAVMYCLFGLLVGVVRHRLPEGAGAVLAVGAAGQVLFALCALRFANIGGLLPGRYLYPAAVAIACLLAIGLTALVPAAMPRLATAGVIGISFLTALAGFVVTGPSNAVQAGFEAPPERAMASVQASTVFAGVVITLDKVAMLPGSDQLWLHVRINNRGESEVDWWPRAKVLVGEDERLSYIDYARSQQFPETLQPGQEASGWLVAKVGKRGRAQPLSFVQLIFTDVAADNYHLVDDVAVEATFPN
ncbi:MAG: hypothetical protein JF888_16070 [Candidatus Dormibacteraeota bacterium]|uniref:Glycosyltransferase RgtA/B/C/D-like domain-containing protein n=1 Tax=Candidatus Dormiibacter inghamiae TaxID=3127013 RepID=A0A934NDK4_9BACT|nr:hypothetical protein [Candidatus Dormibacteraeota bacterium]MBJ7605147.1 hypothetical protein [Candidatus Dormibacteraeota bacterium]